MTWSSCDFSAFSASSFDLSSVIFVPASEADFDMSSVFPSPSDMQTWIPTPIAGDIYTTECVRALEKRTRDTVCICNITISKCDGCSNGMLTLYFELNWVRSVGICGVNYALGEEQIPRHAKSSQSNRRSRIEYFFAKMKCRLSMSLCPWKYHQRSILKFSRKGFRKKYTS